MTKGVRSMDRWLGDGGMAIVTLFGASFDAYGVDGEDLGWVEGTFVPTALACNPNGVVQAGIHAVLLDAVCNFAISAALPSGDRPRATLEIKVETMRPAALGERCSLRGEVVRMARQVAYGEGVVRGSSGEIASRATATFLLSRTDERS
jgi:uncharacterized protein (TIGR00369 family)